MQKLTGQEIPERLREIPQPPKQLYIVGTLPDPSYIYMTVVGSRNHTTYGRDICERLLESLAGYPVVIVSGLASGIDSIAHETALRVGLKTIAFPGSGLSSQAIFPKSNLRLAERILKSGGCLLSEFEPLMQSMVWMFPMRNRLMAGISRATLIIEAARDSGTLITARLTTEYNRELLAVPGPITSPMSYGPNFFIRSGAVVITEPDDLLRALGFEPPITTEQTKVKLEKLASCSPEEKSILETLIEPLERDELARKLSRPIQELNMTLTLMELKGLIKEEYGQIWRT